ncbi:MAG: heavy-metal-associated domain-containing protein [Coriobacteriaceae bacterium]|uniref:heavy-metal-associated domain-containing protein n=1 Tax=Collinsella stercoris TaxID=147206 RepID=UPI003A25F819
MNYIIKTEGLMCGHCDATVETALLNVAGVTDADADHEAQTVTIECSDGVTPEQLAEAVNGAGEKFRALSVQEA